MKSTIRSYNNKNCNYKLTSLPVIDALINNFENQLPKDVIKNTAVYYVHHALYTSINVIEAFIKLGVLPNNIFILGKYYSECDDVVRILVDMKVNYQPCSIPKGIGNFRQNFIRDINWLWARFVDNTSEDLSNIIILDHGGHAVTYFPTLLLERYNVIGIEKTSAGFNNFDSYGALHFPLINVANCAAKKYLESPLIAKAVTKKITSDFTNIDTSATFGVVGLGAIGEALVHNLTSIGIKPIVYDDDEKKMAAIANIPTRPANSLNTLLKASDYIFGCTGSDITKNSLKLLSNSSKDKTLISCSSEDIEFLSLLRIIDKNQETSTPIKNIEYKTPSGVTISILRGGFPVNFDFSGESVPHCDIQLTRALILSSFIQAVQMLKQGNIKNTVYALDPVYQQFIVNEWEQYNNKNNIFNEAVKYFAQKSWIVEHSKGKQLKTHMSEVCI